VQISKPNVAHFELPRGRSVRNHWCIEHHVRLI
jgi:hypothetical protein